MHLTIEIAFCRNNLANGTEKVKQALEHDPNIRISEYHCQRKCKICKEHFYALVDGKMYKANTAEQLLSDIHYFLENEWL